MAIQKFGVTMQISDELYFMSRTEPEFERKVLREVEHPVTEGEWATYREGVRLLDALRKNPYFEEGGSDYGAEITKPEPRVEYIYAETHEEWLARCRALEGRG